MFRMIATWALAVGMCAEASAHFLWIVPNPASQAKTVDVYFSETASPDDPALLKKFSGLTVVAVSRNRDDVKRQEIELKMENDALVGVLPGDASSPLTAQHTYGVVSRKGEPFLLKYYAKAYPTSLPGRWAAVNDPEAAALEITPRLTGGDLVLGVTWKGKPVAGDEVVIDGPGLNEKLQGETDAEGTFRCRLPASGLYSIRARHVEHEQGMLGDQRYTSIRHYATLSLPYSLPEVAAVNHTLPPLPKGVTSFGAAVAGEDLYVYGGHFGEAHHYSNAGQSNEFLKLSLRSPEAQWQPLPGGPKLTGLAMASHAGKLYRVGGFTAKNSEQEEQDLWSQDGFAMFDPATNTWTDLPPLPEPRSSHDAAVLDGRLYVVGGWQLAGPDSTTWHDTAWFCDLQQQELSWLPVPKPPFQRRALSLAAHDGKLYVLGGMQESGRPTTQVDVFDPATQTWSRGPALIGPDMEGFGNSSFDIGGRLFATTMSGSVQRLNHEGGQWELVGQLAHPRFFHRQLTTPQGDLLVIGGASMQTGKTRSVEVFKGATE